MPQHSVVELVSCPAEINVMSYVAKSVFKVNILRM